MQDKIISFSLWGHNLGYYQGAVKNILLAKQIYPEWICRFYCSNDVKQELIQNLLHENTEVIILNEPASWFGMFWRFYAADSNDTVIFRDTDSRLSQREKEAVDEWLNSKYDFHIMRDHPLHTVPILGGMWGARNGALKGIKNELLEYKKTAEYTDDYHNDQNYLRDKLFSKIVEKAKIHDTFGLKLPFPSKRIHRQFIGQSFNGDDTEADKTHGDLIEALKEYDI